MHVIFGITDLAQKLYYLLNQQGIDVDLFTLDRAWMNQRELYDKPVVAYEDLMPIANEVDLYLAIGYRNMNCIREMVYHRAKADGFRIASFVHFSAIVETENLGEGNLILEQVVVGPYSKLGNCNICYPKVLIAHHTVVENYNFFAISSSVAGNVRIGNRCFLGNNCCTKDGIILADETLIGAGAYIDRDTEVGACYAPARSVRLQKKSSEFY